jgi:hypothetical protein
LIAGFLMRGGPENHLGENRSEINSLSGEPVIYFASVGGIRFGGDDPGGNQLAEAVGEDIGGDALVANHELFVAAKATEHHVADDEQRPAVAQHFDRSVQRATRPTLGGCYVSWHFSIIDYYLQFASKIRILFAAPLTTWMNRTLVIEWQRIST